MRTVALCALALAACHDFKGALDECIDAGRCRDVSDASTGGGSGGGSAGGGGGGGSSSGGGVGGGGDIDAGGVAQIYRSVGQTGPLATGSSNAVVITGGQATFSAALPDRVCVGDVLQLSSDGGSTPDRLYVVHGRTDSTHYAVRDAAGRLAPDVPVANHAWALFRAYVSAGSITYGDENPSISSAVSNFDAFTNGADLIDAGVVWNVAVTADQEGTQGTPVNFSGFVTDRQHFVRLYAPVAPSEVGVSQRHQGVWDDTKARLVLSSDYPVVQGSWTFFRVEGLQVKNTYALTTANEAAGGISLWGGDGNEWLIRDNLIVFGGTGSSINADGIAYVNGGGQATLYFINNIVEGFPAEGIGAYSGDGLDTTVVAYNNTSVKNGHGYSFSTSAAGNQTLWLVNDIGVANAGGDYQQYGNATFHCRFDLSSDATAFGDAGTRLNATVSFRDQATADLRLSTSDTGAKGLGADLSNDPLYPFSADVAGTPRTTPWDLGASVPVP